MTRREETSSIVRYLSRRMRQVFHSLQVPNTREADPRPLRVPTEWEENKASDV